MAWKLAFEVEQETIYRPVTDYERAIFWNKVDVGLSNECWHWKQSCRRNGYGQTGFRSTSMYAHRVAFFLYYGHWPRPMCLHKYTCKRSCCNPLHLREGDQRENLLDPVSPHKY